ncbi:MAG: L-lactate dehydrogenase [Clostridia bacterium]|nr:L-lactate dehydrogenase [Clostridia bacterium]
MTDIRKIGIVGIGNVGATIGYTLMESKLFSEMVLIDLNADKAHGEAMDLNHCLPFLSPMQIYSGNYNDLENAGIVIIAAGVGQKPGETRIDLLQRNTDVLRSITERIAVVNPDCILLIVTNPVDILTYVTLKLSGFPANRVIGSGTVLDTARLKYLVGEKLDVDPRNVHSFIIGEHGDSELAVWSGANVSGINIEDYCPICDHCGHMEELYNLHGYVKSSAYEIIRGKGATFYAIAQATKRIVEAIVRDENTILPVSTYLDGQYGLSDICMSIPAVVGRSGVKHVLDFPLSDAEHASLMKSAEILKDAADSLVLTKI